MNIRTITASALVLAIAAPAAFAGPVNPYDDKIESGTFSTMKDVISKQWEKKDGASMITANAVLNADMVYKKNEDGKYKDNLSLVRNEVTIEARISDMIKAVVGFQLDKTLRENGADVSDDFNHEQFLSQFEIQVKPDFLNGGYVAIGKLKEATGIQKSTELLRVEGNALNDLNEVRQVYGFAVHLPDFMSLMDIDASIFETGQNDLKFEKAVGGSILLSKNFFENKLRLQGGVVFLDHKDSSVDAEIRVPVSIAYKITDAWKVYGEAVYFKNNDLYPDANWSVTGGTSYKIANGITLVGEGTYIEKTLYELAAGVNFKLARNVSVGPEVRYTVYDGQDFQDGQWSFGGRLQVVFGADVENRSNIIDGAEQPASAGSATQTPSVVEQNQQQK